MIQSLADVRDMNEWVASCISVDGLTLADRDFARLVAVTVCVMKAWELKILGSRPILWKRLPRSVTVRPEWDVLIDRYAIGNTQILGMKPFHDSVIVEAHKILRIQIENSYA